MRQFENGCFVKKRQSQYFFPMADKMAEKALNLQKQIRENAQDLGDFLSDLNRWEKEMKKDDEELKRSAQIEQVRVLDQRVFALWKKPIAKANLPNQSLV